MQSSSMDTALPGVLRRASNQTGARAHDLDQGLQPLQSASNSLAGGALIGPCGIRFQNTLDAFQQSFLTARAAHEEVADALSRAVGPIQEEQEAREALRRSRQRLAGARRRLVVEQEKVTAQEMRNLRLAVGEPVPVDRSGLIQAERDVEEAELDVRRAERRHDEADSDRERALRALTTVCHGASVLGPLPAAPGSPATVTGDTVLGPGLQDDRFDKPLPTLGRRTAGAGLTPQERRRLARNGLSPRPPLFSLISGSNSRQGALFDGGDDDGGYALGHREYSASGGLGRIGKRYGAQLDGSAEAYAAEGHLRWQPELGPADGKVEGGMKVGGGEASAGLGLNAGSDGFQARGEAEAFVGFKAGVEQELSIAGVKQTAGVEGQAGVGASVEGDLGYDGGKFKFQVSVGAALGFGGKVKLGGEVDVPKLADPVVDKANDVFKAATGWL